MARSPRGEPRRDAGNVIRHEPTIQKRWNKKSLRQREQILLKNWPAMPKTHRPDFETLRFNARTGQEPGTEFRGHFMWPYINLEDLTKPKTLLLLIKSRGRNLPSVFASADLHAMHVGTTTRGLKLGALDYSHWFVLLNGARTLEEYGKIIHSENERHDVAERLKMNEFNPRKTLAILEAQEKILDFLVSCCKQILWDIPSQELTNPRFPIQDEPHPTECPLVLDLTRMEQILRAQVAAAEDHLWSLREDPAYLEEQLKETRDTRQANIIEHNGRLHPWVREGHEDELWSVVVPAVVWSAFSLLEVFSQLHEEVQILQHLHEKYMATISPTENLPEEFLIALLKFRVRVENLTHGIVKNYFIAEVIASSSWRSCFEFEIGLRPGIKMNGTKTAVFHVLKMLLIPLPVYSEIGFPLIIEELERVLESDSKARTLLTSRTASLLSDCTITSQCMHQVDTFFPWSLNFQSLLEDRERQVKQTDDVTDKYVALLLETLKGEDFKHIAAKLTTPLAANPPTTRGPGLLIGNPENKRFHYPIEKPRTKANVEALRKAEQNLDSFWAAVDAFVYSRCGITPTTAQRRLLSQKESLMRTPEWKDPGPSAKRSGKEMVLSSIVKETYKPYSVISFGEPIESHGAPITSTSIEKMKTKLATTSLNIPTDITPPLDTDATTSTELSIQVDQRSLKVFRIMFYHESIRGSPGSVQWSEFLHAMLATKVFSAEKQRGSSWHFQRLDGKGGVHIHEPHPGASLSFHEARRVGRRLNRWFHWTGDTFCVAEQKL
ncbi:hypothetical protein F5Y16DRAFT_414012 [Xylariaceae sp. FL0255]|nr:hypothetical protein F5Y16DRAFT_414012 [Xylariaceae sp. FL0255]